MHSKESSELRLLPTYEGDRGPDAKSQFRWRQSEAAKTKPRTPLAAVFGFQKCEGSFLYAFGDVLHLLASPSRFTMDRNLMKAKLVPEPQSQSGRLNVLMS